MKVQIRAVAPQGLAISQLPFGGYRRLVRNSDGTVTTTPISARFFPVGSFREIEVLDQEDDPTVMLGFPNPTTPGDMIKFEACDPDRMGRKAYAEIVASGQFTVQETAGIDARISGAEVAAAKAEVVRLSSDLAGANILNAGLRQEIETLKTRLAAQVATKADKLASSKKTSKEDRTAT